MTSAKKSKENDKTEADPSEKETLSEKSQEDKEMETGIQLLKDENTDNEESKDPVTVKNKDTENKLSKEGSLKGIKEDEHVETIHFKEQVPVQVTKEEEDTEMKDATSNSHDLQQKAEVQLADKHGDNASDKIVSLSESEKDTHPNGQWDNVGGNFPAIESHKQDVEAVHSEADQGKPISISHFVVANQQEAHPAGVGVST